MRATFQSIKPYSSLTQYSATNAVRVINKSRRAVPGRLISEIVSLARKVHKFHKSTSDKPMHDYMHGECHSAALIFRTNALQFIEGLEDTDIIRGWEVPGSEGYIKGYDRKGLHHLALLCFKDIYVGVDIAVAQLYQANDRFKKTEVLITITEANGKAFVEGLKQAYSGGDWLFLPFGF